MNTQYSLFPQQEEPTGQARDENWKKSIPAQVFLNYFFAISHHLQHAGDAGALYNLFHFINHKPHLENPDLEQIKQHLVSCWSTEYALRTTGELGNGQYLRNALHWTFPQAYYSVFAGLQAFLHTLGITGTNTDLIRREVGRLVVKGAYPTPIAFYAAGHYGEDRIHRLPLSAYKPGLNLASKELEAQAQIGQFLRTTRKLRAKNVRQQVQSNPATALRSARTGRLLEKFGPGQWQQLTWRIGYTTFFDLLGRLKISANHREIQRFVQSEIDFRLFHESLVYIVSYLNFVHEAYVAQAMGLAAYTELVGNLPSHLQNSFVQERLKQKVGPVLERLTPPAAPDVGYLPLAA